MKLLSDALLFFRVASLQVAIPVSMVRMVIRAVAVTPIPDAPSLMYGVIDFHGDIVPVINLRERFQLAPKGVEVNDRFILVNTGTRLLALASDGVEGVKKPLPEEISVVKVPFGGHQTDPIQTYGLEPVHFVSDNNELIIIYDPEKLLGSQLPLLIEELLTSAS